MDELKSFYEKHTKAIFYAVAFLLPFFVTLALFAVRKIYPFGDITFLKKDMYQQYTPFSMSTTESSNPATASGIPGMQDLDPISSPSLFTIWRHP